MTTPIKLAPSILSADFTRLGEQLAAAEASGADWLHIDVMDGRFVPNLSFGLPIVEAARRVSSLPLDVHLMIVEPDHLLEAFAQAGANSITVHYEVSVHLQRTLSTIRALGCRAGVALNPHTPASVVSEIIDDLDLILVMTVNPGYGGQPLIPRTLEKVRQVRGMIWDRAVDIQVDGGINTQTAPAAVDAGANVLVVGSAVYNQQQSVAEGIAALRQVLNQ